MPGYGPQDEERYARQKAEFDAAHPSGRKRRSARIISRPSVASTSEEINEEPTSSESRVIHVRAPGFATGDPAYIRPHYQQQVLIAITLSLIVTLMASAQRGTTSVKTTSQYLDPKVDGRTFAFAWAAILVILIAAASLRSTDKLAAAFGWLIFVAVMLANGTTAFAWVQHMLGNTGTSTGAHVTATNLGNPGAIA